MKLLHLIYSHSIGGAEKYLLDLVPGLKEKGIEVEIIYVSPASQKEKLKSFVEVLEEKRIKVINISVGRKGILLAAYKVYKYCKQNKVGVIHSHLFNADLIAVLAKKIFNNKLIVLSTKHGYSEKYFVKHCANMGVKDRNLYYFISKFICRNINESFAVSKAMADLYYNLKLIKKPMAFIHHGVNINKTTASIEKKSYGSPVIIIVGRLAEVKGHKYLLDAMPAVIKIYPGVQLLVIGQGECEHIIKEQANKSGLADNIIFLGFKPDVQNYFVQADIVVQPSLFESFGLVYIEAFALKIPVVGFDVAACNEIIQNNETGLLAPIFDSASLAEKIIYLLGNPSERKRLTENAYIKYQSYFTVNRMVNQTVEWYQTILP